jgi:hypothetical protein
MNVSVDHDGSAKRRVSLLQFVIAGIGHGSAPEVAGAGMDQGKTITGILLRKFFQPSQAFFTDAGKHRRYQLLDAGKKRRELRRFGSKCSETFRSPKHLVGISADPGPSEGADLIDDLRRVSSTVSQIATMDDEVRRDLPQVGEHGFESAPVAVNVRYDRDSHLARRLCDNRLAVSPLLFYNDARGDPKALRSGWRDEERNKPIMSETQTPRRIGRSIGAVLAGIVVGIILTIGTDVVLHVIGVFPPWGASMVGFDGALLLATVYRTVYGIVASYIIARLAPDRPMAHALAGGVLGIAVSILGAALTWNKGPAFGPHWYPLALIVLAMPQAWAGGKLRVMQVRERPAL